MSYDRNCTKCPLHKTATTVCVGADVPKWRQGEKRPDILIVGEAPGAEEDAQGTPFVGRSGKGLRMVLEDLGLTKRAVITNVVKCRPPDNRPPRLEEIRRCEGYLQGEIERLEPKYLVLLGATAIKWANGGEPLGVGQARGRQNWQIPYAGGEAQVIATYHPAAALREPSRWIDIGEDLGRVLKGTFTPAQTVSVRILERAPATLPLLLAFDLETEGLDPYGTGKILCVSWSSKEGVGFVTRDVEGFVDTLKAMRESPVLIGHNLKFDLLWLREKYGYVHQGRVIDTMVAAHLTDENSPNGLKHCVHQLTGYGDYAAPMRDFFDIPGTTTWEDRGTEVVRTKITPSGKIVQKSIDAHTLLTYGAWDAAVTWKLWSVLKGVLSEEKLTRLFDAEMSVLQTLIDVESRGMGLDLGRVKAVRKTLKGKITKLDRKLHDALGMDVNLDSPSQLATALSARGVVLVKETGNGAPSTSEASLQATVRQGLKDEDERVVTMLLERRGLQKVVRTYLDPYLSSVDPTARLHARFNLTGTKTGRLSCADPNLQNIPRDSEIKRVFVGGKGRALVWADYSQIELRIGAQITQDPVMLDEIRSGRDIHSTTAEALFGPAFTKEQRAIAKTINFGIFYGAGPTRIAEEGKLSVKEASRLLKDWFSLYSRVKDWMKEMEEQLRDHGYVTDLFGRKRRLPAYVPTDDGSRALVVDRGEYGHMLRQACNMPIQGTAGQITKLAMVSVQWRLGEEIPGAFVVSNIHDSILVECPARRQKRVGEILKATMEDANGIIKEHGFKVKITVPTPVEVGMGLSWE